MNDEKMTATERLRQLLDERGVEWTRGRYDRREFTRWYIRNNSGFIAASFRDVLADGNEKPYLRCEFYHITPEQAVEATLGRGMCEVDATIKWDWDRCEPYWEHELSCGHTITTMEPEPPNYCPECGRRVKR